VRWPWQREKRDILTTDEFIEAVRLAIPLGYEQTISQTKVERIAPDYAVLATQAYAGNPTVFACMDTRAKVFSGGRFRWRRVMDGRPSDYFGTADLRLLERPWAGGTTQNLMSRMINDADTAGNSFWVRFGSDLVRLRPDWVEIAVEPLMVDGAQIGFRKLGYVYYENGKGAGSPGAAFLPNEVAHFMPVPDPLHPFRGMSWLTPLVRELQGDYQMTRHQEKFFENGATPNMVVKHPPGTQKADILAFDAALTAKHVGVENAGKTLNLYPGADVTVVGLDFDKMDFSNLRGDAETRIAAAAGTPPIVAGLKEGLESATYSNYAQARRRFADGTMHALWQEASGSLEVLLDAPDGAELAHDASEVPFLREDEGDAANIQATRASTINSLITAGFTPQSAAAAVDADDFRLLVHTGLYSVQLQPAGAQTQAPTPDAPRDAAIIHFGRRTA